MNFLLEEDLFLKKRPFMFLFYACFTILTVKFCASNQTCANLFNIGLLMGGADFCYKDMKGNNENQEEMQSWYSKNFFDL